MLRQMNVADALVASSTPRLGHFPLARGRRTPQKVNCGRELLARSLDDQAGASHMVLDKPIPGPIEGLHLPSRAWKVLQEENITTLDQLITAASRIERMSPGIGRKTARKIRAELARVLASERQPFGETLL